MRLKKNQQGQGTTEYILIMALIAVAIIVAVKLFGASNRANIPITAGNATSNNTPTH